MPAPTVRGSQATQTGAAGTSIVVARNTITHVLGEVLIVHIGYTGAVATITPPTATGPWALWFNTTASSLVCQAVYWKIAGPSDTAASTYTFTFSASTTAVAHLHAVQNGDDDPANWLKVQASGTSTAPAATALVAQQPNCLILHLVTTRSVTGVTPPASYAELLDTSSTTGTPDLIRIEDATIAQAADGTTGAPAAAIATSQAWVAGRIVVPSADYPMVRAATTGTTTTVTASVTVPAGTLAGEFRLVAIRIPNQTTTVTTPAGWTLIGPQASNATGAFRVYWFWRIAGGTPGLPTTDGTQAFTLSTAVTTTGWQSTTVRRTHATTPVGASAPNANAATATTYAHPGVTTANAGSLVLTSFHASAAATWTPPTSYTERSDANQNEVADRVLVAAGATGTLTGTLSVTGFSVGLALEVRFGAAPALPTIPTWRSSVAAAGGSGQTTIAMSKPPTTIEGDLIIHDVSVVSDTATVTPPAGYTLIAQASVTNTGASPDHKLLRYARVASPSEPASVTYTISVASSVQGQSHAITSVPAGLAALGPGSTASGNSTTPSTAGVTTSGANSLLLYVASTFGSSATAAAPAGMTLALQSQNQQLFYERRASAGATGTRGQTITSDQWTATLLEVAVAAVSGGPFPLPARKPSHQLMALLRR